MALFGTQRSSSSSSSPNTVRSEVSLVGKDTVFEGALEAENDVRASGRVLGRLHVQGKAVVTESGVVEGEVRATEASIAGHVRGDIIVEERLVLRETARVDGNIEAGRLVVEEGAIFVGECTMNGPLPDLASSSDGMAARDEPTPEVQPADTGSGTPHGEDDASPSPETPEAAPASAESTSTPPS